MLTEIIDAVRNALIFIIGFRPFWAALHIVTYIVGWICLYSTKYYSSHVISYFDDEKQTGESVRLVLKVLLHFTFGAVFCFVMVGIVVIIQVISTKSNGEKRPRVLKIVKLFCAVGMPLLGSYLGKKFDDMVPLYAFVAAAISVLSLFTTTGAAEDFGFIDLFNGVAFGVLENVEAETWKSVILASIGGFKYLVEDIIRGWLRNDEDSAKQRK
ncbi:hypothetical protein ACP275_03G011300 [Erythranthe tilingii]